MCHSYSPTLYSQIMGNIESRILRYLTPHSNILLLLCVRIKSGEQGIPVFSMPGRLGGVICKPEGAA